MGGQMRKHEAQTGRSGPEYISELEHAIALAAYIVLRHGDFYAPFLDLLEKELVEAKTRETPRAKAKRLLRAYATPAHSRELQALSISVRSE